MKKEHWVEINGRSLRLSNLEKVLFPAAKFTKAQVIDYYARIAPVMLPHLRDRPVTLKRYPEGAHTTPFYEKNCPKHKPEWVSTAAMQTSRKEINLCLINEVAALVWIANLASLEVHTYLARSKNLDRPDFLAFDLDPGAPAGLLEAAGMALRLREILASRGLESLAKVSGGKGVHIYAPLNTAVDFDRSKTFAGEVARTMERDDPARVVSKMSKALRKGKVFVDWSQNDRHKTTVCVYSMRAQREPTISAPVTWDELEEAVRRRRETGLRFSPEDVLRRVEAQGDLFEPVLRLKQKLPRPSRAGEEEPGRRATLKRGGWGKAAEASTRAGRSGRRSRGASRA